MNIKNSIQLIEYSGLLAVTGFLLLILTYIGIGQSIDAFNIVFFAISLILIFAFVFKNLIIRLQLQKSKYKNIFYAIIDSIQLEEKFLSPKQKTAPTSISTNYSACEFIKDNHLNTAIGMRKNRSLPILLTYGIYLVAMLTLNRYLQLNINYITIIVVFGAILIGYYFLFNNAHSVKKTRETLISFDNKNLNIYGNLIAWPNIIDWQYKAKDKNNEATVNIYYRNALLKINSIKIELNTVNTNKIDLILLLTIFKEKYGYNIY